MRGLAGKIAAAAVAVAAIGMGGTAYAADPAGTLGPDGKTDYLVYHAWDPQLRARRMCIDPLVWEQTGPRCLGPS